MQYVNIFTEREIQAYAAVYSVGLNTLHTFSRAL